MIKQALIAHLHDPAGSIEIMASESNLVKPPSTTAGEGTPLSAFTYYLEHGIYPWWFTGDAYRTPQQLLQELSAQQLETLAGKLLHWQNTGSLSASMRERFLNVFDISAYQKFLPVFLDQHFADTVKANNQFLEWQVFAEILSGQFSVNKEILFRDLLHWLLSEPPRGNQDLAGVFAVHFFRQHGNEFNPSDIIGAADTPEHLRDLLQRLAVKHIEKINKEPEPELTKSNTGSNHSVDVLAEGIYITNAGLVILHPFLPSLFATLDLMGEDGIFYSDGAAVKACVVMHYLQTGNGDYQEPDMAFNKITCGLDVSVAIANDIVISESERQECDELLGTVIKYWEVLKGSGIDALRQSFLHRNGKLSLRDNALLLQVERQTIDVMLDRLPWGITTIKLPWLDKLIFTEW
jgi:hypothetical protein